MKHTAIKHPRWEVVVASPILGKRKFVTRQPTREAAIEKAKRAYPGCALTNIKRLLDPPTVGGRNGNPVTCPKCGAFASYQE